MAVYGIGFPTFTAYKPFTISGTYRVWLRSCAPWNGSCPCHPTFEDGLPWGIQSSPRVPGYQSSWPWMTWRYPNCRKLSEKIHGKASDKPQSFDASGQWISTPTGTCAPLIFSPCRGPGELQLSRSLNGTCDLQEQCNTSWGYSYCQTKHGGYTCPISCKDNETLCAIQRSRLSRP